MENAIKIDTAIALVESIDANYSRGVWTKHLSAALEKRGAYNRIVADLNACLDGSKILTYTPDGVPAFITPEGK